MLSVRRRSPRTISMLRHALEDDVRQPRYIETVPKRGYRLIASVERQPTAQLTAPIDPETPSSSRPSAQPRRVRRGNRACADRRSRPAADVVWTLARHGRVPAASRRFRPSPLARHPSRQARRRLSTTRDSSRRTPRSIDALAGLATAYAFRVPICPIGHDGRTRR